MSPRNPRSPQRIWSWIVVGALVAAPGSVSAQRDGSNRIDIVVGFEHPVEPVRNDATYDVRRTNVTTLGISWSDHARRAVSWRFSGEVGRGRLRAEQKFRGIEGGLPGASDTHDRLYFGLSGDVARRVHEASFASGVLDLRLHAGAGARWIRKSGYAVCVSIDACGEAGRYPERVAPVARSGIILTFRRPELTSHLELGYLLSRPWSVVQHDLVTRLGFAFLIF